MRQQQATRRPAAPGRLIVTGLLVWTISAGCLYGGSLRAADEIASIETATATHIAAPYELYLLEGAGHWLPEEAAETVSRLLIGQATADYGEDPVDRSFDPETRIFSSSADPKFELTIPADYLYLGRLSFPLKGIAWVDRHVFAKLSGNTVERAIILQFEHMLDGHEGAYAFGVPPEGQRAGANYRFSPERIDLGSHAYVHNTWAFDQREGATQQPGSESDRTLRYLDGRGLEIDDALIMSRFVREVGEARRRELILFYLEPLAARGHSLADFPDGGPVSSRYDSLSTKVTDESLSIFRTLRDKP